MQILERSRAPLRTTKRRKGAIDESTVGSPTVPTQPALDGGQGVGANARSLIQQSNPATSPFNNGLQSNALVRTLAHNAATNTLAGTAGGIANVAFDDSDDSTALKFAKGFAVGVALKVAAKHGTNAGEVEARATFKRGESNPRQRLANERKEGEIIETMGRASDSEIPNNSMLAHSQKLESMGDISGKIVDLRKMSDEQKKFFAQNLDLRTNATPVPAKMNEQEFQDSVLKYAKSKQNFLEHIKSRDDAEARMQLLNLVEPTIEKFRYKIINGERLKYII